MCCDRLGAATCSKVDSLRNTEYQERTECLNVAIEVLGGQIVIRGAPCVLCCVDRDVSIDTEYNDFCLTPLPEYASGESLRHCRDSMEALRFSTYHLVELRTQRLLEQ